MSSYDTLPPNENFRGKSYGEWAAEWWKWLLGSENPDYSTGEPVLFLRGAFDYETANGQRRPKRKLHNDRTGDKKIDISEGTAIFFPVIEAEFNFDDPDPDDGGKKIETETRMRYLARRDIDEGDEMGATIQIGKGPRTKIVKDLKDYRAESPLFKLTVSAESPIKDYLDVLPPKDGAFDAVTDGYWILIRSLPPSNEPYRIHFEAKGRGSYFNSATYDIIVKPKLASRVEDKSDSLISGKSIV